MADVCGVLKLYTEWLEAATPEQIAFVDSVYRECEKHYSAGGDTIVECFDPDEILEEFKNLDDARDYCGLRVEQELNARWGEDSDPQVKRAEAFDAWDKESK